MSSGPAISRSLILCATPRTGSYLLCEGIANTGVAGYPTEYFATTYWTYWTEQWRTWKYPAYLERVRQVGTTPNGTFAVKTHVQQFQNFTRQVLGRSNAPAAEQAAAVDRWFANPRYVWLRRRDRLRHAISYARSMQTEIWWLTDEAPAPPNNPPKPEALRFDPALIERAADLLAEAEDMWARFFDEAGIQPLVLHYEDLLIDYPAQVRRVVEHVGEQLDASFRLPASKFQRQADALTERWAERYEAHRATQPA